MSAPIQHVAPRIGKAWIRMPKVREGKSAGMRLCEIRELAREKMVDAFCSPNMHEFYDAAPSAGVGSNTYLHDRIYKGKWKAEIVTLFGKADFELSQDREPDHDCSEFSLAEWVIRAILPKYLGIRSGRRNYGRVYQMELQDCGFEYRVKQLLTPVVPGLYQNGIRFLDLYPQLHPSRVWNTKDLDRYRLAAVGNAFEYLAGALGRTFLFREKEAVLGPGTPTSVVLWGFDFAPRPSERGMIEQGIEVTLSFGWHCDSEERGISFLVDQSHNKNLFVRQTAQDAAQEVAGSLEEYIYGTLGVGEVTMHPTLGRASFNLSYQI